MHVSELKLAEQVFLDTERLDEICARLGEGGAETAICTAMEELAELLQLAGGLRRAGQVDVLGKTAAEVKQLAICIGMPGLARVSDDVRSLCAGSDAAALAATVARMRRLGEQSLLAMWDQQDLTV